MMPIPLSRDLIPLSHVSTLYRSLVYVSQCVVACAYACAQPSRPQHLTDAYVLTQVILLEAEEDISTAYHERAQAFLRSVKHTPIVASLPDEEDATPIDATADTSSSAATEPSQSNGETEAQVNACVQVSKDAVTDEQPKKAGKSRGKNGEHPDKAQDVQPKKIPQVRVVCTCSS